MHVLAPTSSQGGRLVAVSTQATHAGMLYVGMIGVRIALYIGHVVLQRYQEVYLLSDHIFLAASILASFQSELVLCLSDVYKTEIIGPTPVRGFFVVVAFVVNMFLYVFVAADMYFTARFFHHVSESVFAVVAGFCLFQAPILIWLKACEKAK